MLAVMRRHLLAQPGIPIRVLTGILRIDVVAGLLRQQVFRCRTTLRDIPRHETEGTSTPGRYPRNVGV